MLTEDIKDIKEEYRLDLLQLYSHLGVEAFPDMQKAALDEIHRLKDEEIILKAKEIKLYTVIDNLNENINELKKQLKESKNENKKLKETINENDKLYKSNIAQISCQYYNDLLDVCNGYWNYDHYGDPYMYDVGINSLLLDIEKKIKQKYVDGDKIDVSNL